MRALPALLILLLLSCGNASLAPPQLERGEQAMMMNDAPMGVPIGPETAPAGGRFGAAIAATRRPDGGVLVAISSPGSGGVGGSVSVVTNVFTDGGYFNPFSTGGSTDFGTALAWGDFNADGFPDLAVGAPSNIGDGGVSGEGEVIVYKGTGSFVLSVPGQHLSNPITSLAQRTDAHFGCSLSVAHHWNGDAADDLIIGACGAGITWVYLGVTGTSVLVSPLPALEIDEGGAAVAAVDIDGNGHSDVVTSDPLRSTFAGQTGELAWQYNGSMTPQVYSDPFVTAGARFGAALADLGDIDGSNGEDLAVGAPGWDAGSGAEGALRFLTGGPNGLFEYLLMPGSGPGGELGASLANIGVIDKKSATLGLLVGAPGQSDAGAAVLYDVGAIRATGQALPLVRFSGGPVGSRFGSTVAGGVDLNGDGQNDILVGAPEASPDVLTPHVGKVYVFFGPLLPSNTIIDGGMTFDAGAVDAGTADAGVADAGSEDAGSPDDAGTADAGPPSPSDAGLSFVPQPDGGLTNDRSPLDFTTRACGCDAAGPGVLLPLLLAPARRRARAARGSSRTPAPKPSAPRRS